MPILSKKKLFLLAFLCAFSVCVFSFWAYVISHCNACMVLYLNTLFFFIYVFYWYLQWSFTSWINWAGVGGAWIIHRASRWISVPHGRCSFGGCTVSACARSAELPTLNSMYVWFWNLMHYLLPPGNCKCNVFAADAAKVSKHSTVSHLKCIMVATFSAPGWSYRAMGVQILLLQTPSLWEMWSLLCLPGRTVAGGISGQNLGWSAMAHQLWHYVIYGSYILPVSLHVT